jgi:hypothetical protein
VEEAYSYDLEQPKEWWIKVAPWLKHLVTFLKFGVPFAGAVGAVVDEAVFKEIESQVKLLEEITKDLADFVESDALHAEDEGLHTTQEPVVGAALRVLYSFLKEKDPDRFWGGLQRVITPDGNILWLCHKHAQPYEVRPLSIGG